MPDDGKRYEVVDGELYVSKQPDYHHQRFCLRLGGLLDAWCLQTGAGEANAAPVLQSHLKVVKRRKRTKLRVEARPVECASTDPSLTDR